MLDLKKIRNNPEGIKKAMENRGEDFDVSLIDKVLELDKKRREMLVEVENMKNVRNQESAQIPKLKKRARMLMI